MSAPKGNRFAQKGDEPRDTMLHCRVSRRDKSSWVYAARPGKLADWVIKTLNTQAQHDIALREAKKLTEETD